MVYWEGLGQCSSQCPPNALLYALPSALPSANPSATATPCYQHLNVFSVNEYDIFRGEDPSTNRYGGLLVGRSVNNFEMVSHKKVYSSNLLAWMTLDDFR